MHFLENGCCPNVAPDWNGSGMYLSSDMRFFFLTMHVRPMGAPAKVHSFMHIFEFMSFAMYCPVFCIIRISWCLQLVLFDSAPHTFGSQKTQKIRATASSYMTNCALLPISTVMRFHLGPHFFQLAFIHRSRGAYSCIH